MGSAMIDRVNSPGYGLPYRGAEAKAGLFQVATDDMDTLVVCCRERFAVLLQNAGNAIESSRGLWGPYQAVNVRGSAVQKFVQYARSQKPRGARHQDSMWLPW